MRPCTLPAFLLLLPALAAAEPIRVLESAIERDPVIVTGDDPANHLLPAPGPYQGVARLWLHFLNGYTYGCSGALLAGGTQVLTAAHCVSDPSGGNRPLETITARFYTGGGRSMDVAGVRAYTPPGWNGDANYGFDIAVIQLASVVPLSGYQLYRGDAAGSTVFMAGYGYSGRGATGRDYSVPIALRGGENQYELYWLDERGVPSFYGFDFDSGNDANDAFGVAYDIHNLGLGTAREADIAPGDSGGPSFVDGRIAGVHSWYGRFDATTGNPDVDGTLNASWGEFAGDTRVDLYAGWVDSLMAPEPGLGAAAAIAALAFGVIARRRAARR